MKQLRLSILCLSACAFLAVRASARQVAPTPAETVAKVVELGRTDSQVMRFLDHVTNRIGPRLTGSDGYENACHWAREEFVALGLENVRLERWGEFPVGFNRGPSSGRMLTPVARELRFGTNAWTAGTQGRVAGLAILAPTDEAELDAIRPKLAGAWVVVKAAPPPARGAERRPASADRAFREARDKAYDEAGIAGTIRAARGELVLTSGSQKVDWNALPKRPAIQMVAEDHAAILEQIEKGAEVRLEFDVRNWFERGPIQLSNVIAEIPGSEKPDEYVIVGGHIDSWDGAEGAQDNGTGVATTLEAARLLAKSGVKPKRTIRFELWSGEEQGLFGSAGFVRDHAAELERISAALVHDGGTNYLSGIVCTPEMEDDLRAVFAPVVGLDAAMPFTLAVSEGLRNSGDSDHASFLSKGVPGFFWEQAGDTDYDFVHHTQNDTFETARQDYQRHSAIVVAVGALGIANLDHLLSRENLKGIELRRMGVQLDGTKVTSVFEVGVAATAGWKEGDVILAIDGVEMKTRNEVTATLQKGGPKKTFTMQRGEEKLEVVLDWSNASGEKERAARAERRAAAAAAAVKH